MIKKITEWVNCYDIFTNIRPNVFLSSEMEDGFEYKAYIPLSMMEPDYIYIYLPCLLLLDYSFLRKHLLWGSRFSTTLFHQLHYWLIYDYRKGT